MEIQKKSRRNVLYAAVGIFLLSVMLFAFGNFAFAANAETRQTEKASAQSTTASSASKTKLKKENGYYRCYVNGKLVKSKWKTINGKKYYFDKKGNAATLNTKIGGKYYVFDKKGVLQAKKGASVRIITIGSKKYQVNADGTVKKGWSKDKKYYFYKNGEMVKGIEVIGEKFYWFHSKTGKYSAEKTSKLRKAAKYEKDFAPLKKIIGKPVKAKYYSSCYGDGKDGILKYKNFTVYTFKYRTSGKEVFMGAE